MMVIIRRPRAGGGSRGVVRVSGRGYATKKPSGYIKEIPKGS